MKLIKKILLLSLTLIPVIVLADTAENIELLPEILIAPAFVSIHMTIFVLTPIAQIFSGPEEYKDTVKVLFITRLIIIFGLILLFGEIAVMIDFFAVFLGAFLVVPIVAGITSAKMR